MATTTEYLLADYLDLAPFAEQVGRHPRTVRRWMDQPDGLPYTKLGNRILIRLESARQWIAAQERKPNPRRKPDSLRRRNAAAEAIA